MKLSGCGHNNIYNPILFICAMVQDTSNIKEKILSTLKQRGPSLPVHIAGGTGLSMLFASAFLSELFSEKKIKISNMKVGNSPIYFLPEQEFMLQNFSQFLKSKEKDAFILLKQKKFLKDREQEPAIRVALRSINDFAIPFKKNEEIFWRYFTEKEELKIKEKPKQDREKEGLIQIQTPSKEPEKTLPSEDIKESEEKTLKKPELNVFDKQNTNELDIFEKKQTKSKKKITRKRTSHKKNEKFFNKVKEYLEKKSIEILDIESFSKNDLILKIKKDDKEKLLMAYNKKRITEPDLIKAYNKSSEIGLPYMILSLGEPTKKLSNFIKAIKKLEKISKID